MIPGRDFEMRPQGRPADVLRLVPGLVINQHQGGGKAEQYLIRGFDADHGTDLAIFVDGLPVNLRSHAHGQGYADLHFLIPETVKSLDVLKQRYLALVSPTRDALKTLVAVELYRNDGPFAHPNGSLRFNAFAKATADVADDMRVSLWASHYRAEWHASGEIPARAVRSGLIDRFGAIDPNQGGVTERTNLNIDYSWRVTESQRVTAHAYATHYALTLFNDFTFFLNDPDHGDMINQRDTRWMGGLDVQYEIKTRPFGIPLVSTAGFQYRIDTPHVVLASAVQRHQTSRTQDIDIVEQSYAPFVKFDLQPLDRVRLVAGARGDIVRFQGDPRVNTGAALVTKDLTSARPHVKANLVRL